jgi:ceramide glucosyltransferase
MFYLLLKVVTALGALSAAGFYVLALLGAASFRRRAAADHASAQASRATARTSEKTPPVSLLKPLRGTDPYAYESLRSHCLLDYPHYEIIFGVADPADPAVALVERLIREFPARAIRLVICSQALGANRKVSNLIQMLPHAAHDHLLINDGDIHVPTDYLRRVMAPFHDHRVGMVTCLYRGVPARTLGSKLESLAISTEFFPGVLAALRLEKGMRFALGSTLAFPRRALAAIGGFEPLLDYLADDFELGCRIAAAGFEVVLADVVVETHLPNYTFADFFSHQLRWGRSTRDSRPWGYTGVLLTQGLPWALAAVAALYLPPSSAVSVPGWGSQWGWMLLALIFALRLAVADIVGRKILHDNYVWPNIYLLPLRDLIGLTIWIGSYTGRRVRWREEEFILKKGRLKPA